MPTTQTLTAKLPQRNPYSGYPMGAFLSGLLAIPEDNSYQVDRKTQEFHSKQPHLFFLPPTMEQ